MDSRAKRLKVEAECLAASRCTKSDLADVLRKLHETGFLNRGLGGGTGRQVRLELQRAHELHAKTVTPYGPVVQTMVLPWVGLASLDYAHPQALLYHLSNVSPHFSDVMWNARALKPAPAHLTVVLYIDEVIPGNPMRHDKGRTMQAVYWCITDWPQYVLQRAEAWPALLVLQSKRANAIPGGITSVIPFMMKAFWPNHQPSVSFIVHRQKEVVITLECKGWIADLKAHAEIFGCKTTAATKPCHTCKNVIQHLDLEVHAPVGTRLVGMNCSTYAQLIYATDEHIYSIVDELARVAALGNVASLEALQTRRGYNHIPGGMLLDLDLRLYVQPSKMRIRDWMHVLVSGGVAGTEMACMLQCLDDEGIGPDFIVEAAMRYHLPYGRGKPQAAWFDAEHIGEKNMKSFASEQLTMIALLAAIIDDFITPRGILPLHAKCFQLIAEIVAILSLGPEGAMPFCNVLRALIEKHADLYVQIYPDQVRPKFHHLFHIPDNMEYVGKLLSCFVTERKHRATKAASRELFRHIEHTVIVDLVNRQCAFAASVESPFKAYYLVGRRSISIGGLEMHTSGQAHLPCGYVHKGDLVFCTALTVGKIIRFLQFGEQIVAETSMLQRIDDTRWAMAGLENLLFLQVSTIVSPLIYAKVDADTIRIIVPWPYRQL